MVHTTAQPAEHCPRFQVHCSLECMERTRVQFGCYSRNEPSFQTWCPYSGAVEAQDEARRRAASQQVV